MRSCRGRRARASQQARHGTREVGGTRTPYLRLHLNRTVFSITVLPSCRRMHVGRGRYAQPGGRDSAQSVPAHARSPNGHGATATGPWQRGPIAKEEVARVFERIKTRRLIRCARRTPTVCQPTAPVHPCIYRWSRSRSPRRRSCWRTIDIEVSTSNADREA